MSSGLLALVALLAAPAGAYTIESNLLRVTAETHVDVQIGPGFDSDEAMQEVTGTGELTATATAVAEVTDVPGGPARSRLSVTASVTLAPDQIVLSAEYFELLQGPGGLEGWAPHIATVRHEMIFSVSAPTEFTMSELRAWDLRDLDRGGAIFTQQGILAPGRYEITTFLSWQEGMDYTSTQFLTLRSLPEPGTALLLGLGAAALARRRLRAA